MKSATATTSRGRTSTVVSSRVSRTTACSTASPTSTAPPGILHRHWEGGSLRPTRRTCEPRNTIAPTAGTGRGGNSYVDIRCRHGRNRLERCDRSESGRRESSGVVASADARVGRASLEAFVVAEHDDLAPEGIPQGVRVPGLDQLVAPRSGDHHDKESIIEADRFEDANLVNQRECLYGLA